MIPAPDEGEGVGQDILSLRLKSHKMQMLQQLDLGAIQRRLLLQPPKGKGLCDEEAETVIEWYRMFLYLKYRYPKETLLAMMVVDDVWKQHVLDTRVYTVDCERIFEELLHYDPYFGMNNARLRKAAYQRFKELCHSRFGVEWKYKNLLTPKRGNKDKEIKNIIKINFFIITRPLFYLPLLPRLSLSISALEQT